MRILGHSKLDERFREVQVGTADGRPVVLRVYAPRLGEMRRMLDLVPDPLAPMGEVVRDAKGNPVKNARGQVKVERDEEHPDHLKALELAAEARTAGLILGALRDQVETDLTPEACGGHQAYFLKAREEFAEAGLDFGAWKALDEAVGSLLELEESEVEAAAEELGKA